MRRTRFTALAPLLLFLLASAAYAAPERALLALDRTVEGALVAGRNATVHYVVHNVGSSPAAKVALKDLAFPASRFEVFAGAFRHSWGTLAGGASASLEVVMMPKRAGQLIVSPAAVSYVDADGESRVTRLAADDTVVVEDLLAYRRRTDRHRAEWAAYFGAFLLLVVAPYVVSLSLEARVPKAVVAKKKM